jgi:hypothetical protein
MNKEILLVVITAFLVSAGWVSSASAAMKGTPVDWRTCDLRDGKTIEDLNKVTAKFRAYASKSNTEYAAWTLFPQYHTDQDYDLAWMGAWPSAGSFGVSMEGWMKDGKGVAAEFDQVMDCSSRHMMVVSYPINALAGTPEDGMWLFSACNLNEGVTIPQAYAAHLEAGAVMKTMGSLSTSWMMVPSIGAGPNDPDYYHALAFYRYSDLGASLEMFINQGGQEARGEILNKVSSCRTPALFDAVSVRAHDER